MQRIKQTDAEGEGQDAALDLKPELAVPEGVELTGETVKAP